MNEVDSQTLNKTCAQCQIEKPLTAFVYKRCTGRKSYYANYCKECDSKRAAQWQQINKTSAYPKQKQWRTENKPRFNELMRDISKRYYDAKKRATPTWAEPDKIEAVYTEAWRRRFFGEDVEVDHHYPFQGKTVCGFHVHQNLRIVPRLRNRSKRNSHPGD